MGDLAVGIDFGGTKMLGVIVDNEGNIFGQHRMATPYDPTELLDDLIEMVGVLETAAGRRATGLGVGAGGLVDGRGVLAYGPNVGRVTDIDLAEGLGDRRPELSTVIENDANCALWSESRVGAATGASEVVMVTLGTGIGSGLLTGGHIVHGANKFAGELGHMVVEASGLDCVCGKTGCWEAYASGRALGRMGREAAASGDAREVLRLAGAVEDIRGEHVTTAVRAGDAQARVIIDHFSWWVAAGIANAVAILDPEVVLIGGGMAEDADLFIDEVRRISNEMVFGAGTRPMISITRAVLGERAGAIGAALATFGR